MPWVYAPDLQQDIVEIGGSEAHHLLHVLRATTGLEVTLFDGNGCTAEAAITQVGRSTAIVSIRSRNQTASDTGARIVVAVAPPKGDRLRWMTEKLTELGVDALILMESQRTVVNPRETKLDKLRQTIIAACKQSRRPQLMTLHPLCSLQDVLAQAADLQQQLLLAHPGITQSDLPKSDRPNQDQCLLIGPEGGFTAEETDAILAAGAAGLSWPDGILRTETAAIAFSAVVRACLLDG